jgi:F0F1-type ATP synthase delta subunit
MTPEQLRTEAKMLAGRSCLERADYLYEVAHSRGPEVAEALRRLVADITSAHELDRPH